MSETKVERVPATQPGDVLLTAKGDVWMRGGRGWLRVMRDLDIDPGIVIGVLIEQIFQRGTISHESVNYEAGHRDGWAAAKALTAEQRDHPGERE